MDLTTILAASSVAGPIVGWALHKYYAAHKPSERAAALKVGIKAMEMFNKLQSSAPEDVAAAAAKQAHEAALMASFKEAAAKLV